MDELNRQIHHWRSQAQLWRQTAELTRKQWEESEWYLGEARAAFQHLAGQMQALQDATSQSDQRHAELTAKLQEAERQRDEANWLLGEARAAIQPLEGQVQALQDAAQQSAQRHAELTAKLQEAERRRDEITPLLEESQTSGEELERYTDQLTKQLIQVQGELEEARRLGREFQQLFNVEKANRQASEIELEAVRTYGERRRALRKYRSDLIVEVESPSGTLVFSGLPRDISGRGFRFASEQPVTNIPDYLHVRLHLPGEEPPIDATGRVVWQEEAPTSPRYLVGCELTSIPADRRESFERVIATTG